MLIREVYARLDTPRNLERHMLRVAGFVNELHTRWTGAAIDWRLLIQAALLHDVGNVIKFDLDKYPDLLGPEERVKIDYWRQKQADLIARYGHDDHAAADRMLLELNVPPVVRDIITKKSFGNTKDLSVSHDTPSKILLYCDLRVLPHGLGSLDDRIEEFSGRLLKYSKRPDFPDLVAGARAIEREIKSCVDVDIDSFVSEASIDSHASDLLALTLVQTQP